MEKNELVGGMFYKSSQQKQRVNIIFCLYLVVDKKVIFKSTDPKQRNSKGLQEKFTCTEAKSPNWNLSGSKNQAITYKHGKVFKQQ